jgi:tripartite-type tricarboxylate transporter receptor subunit TctC
MKTNFLWMALLGLAALAPHSRDARGAAPVTYPTKPVRLIIPFIPGGGTDLIGRLVASKLSERMGSQIVIENIGGAGTIIGTERVAKSAPDGYTLLFVDPSFMIQPGLQKLPYDPVKSFAKIALVTNGPSAMVVHPSVPVKSVKDLIALAKQKPGQLIFGTAGLGSSAHLGTELFQMMANIQIMMVHYKGGGGALIDALGGHNHAVIGSVVSLKPHIESGKLRGLGTTGTRRSAALPQIPTIAEAGLPQFEVNQYRGLLAPAGTPAPIVDRLNDELKFILASDDFKNLLLRDGSEPDYRNPADYDALIARETARWASVIKTANLQVQK